MTIQITGSGWNLVTEEGADWKEICNNRDRLEVKSITHHKWDCGKLNYTQYKFWLGMHQDEILDFVSWCNQNISHRCSYEELVTIRLFNDCGYEHCWYQITMDIPYQDLAEAIVDRWSQKNKVRYPSDKLPEEVCDGPEPNWEELEVVRLEDLSDEEREEWIKILTENADILEDDKDE